MIDFTLTEEQKACQKLVRDFARKEIVPIAHELDEEQRHSPEIVEKYHEDQDKKQGATIKLKTV